MDLKDRLKALRLEKEITATQLAAAIDKGESAVRMWEIGRSKPDIDTLVKLSEYFGCTTDFLLGTSEYRSNDEKSMFLEDIEVLSEILLKLPDKGKVLYMCFNIARGHEKALGTKKFYDIFLKNCYIVIDAIYSMASTVERVIQYKSGTDCNVFASEIDDLGVDLKNIFVSINEIYINADAWVKLARENNYLRNRTNGIKTDV